MARIVTNTSANTVFKNYTRSSQGMASSMEKLATGLRVNRASDDPAGLAISETLRGNIKGTDAALDAIANANNFINTADGFLQTVHDILGRMEELSVKYGDGTMSTTDKANLALEYNALADEIDNINSNSKFNGITIFGGSSSNVQFTVDAEGTTFSITSGLGTLASPADITSSTQALAAVKSAITTISTQRAQLGQSQSRLQFLATSQQNYAENVSAAEGRIRNVDVAKESANFTKYQILVQSGVAMLSQANSSSQNVLGLLR